MSDRSTFLTWEAEVVLRDGTAVRVRTARPQDEDALVAFYRGLSEQSLVYRFFTRISNAALVDQVRRLLYNPRAVHLVATFGDPPRVVAHGLYAAADSDRAEVAFAVADEFQGRGVGTLLLGQLAEVAARQGIRLFEASVLPTNHRMLEVFRESGFPVEVHAEPGELRVTFPTELTEDALRRFERREQLAAQAALRPFFHPRGVAVVGASRRRGTIGGEIFHNLLQYGFEGPVYPVNPHAEVVQSVVSYPTVEAIPGPVDLAVVVVPAEQVVEVAWQCARKGVRALVVISAGFAEAGEEGRARQEELLRVCRATGMRLIGPNCMGIVNTDPGVRLNATFAPVLPPPGRVGFLSQSGALGLAVMEYANQLGLGLSTFVSVGNKADVSGNDLLNYWDDDPNTDVILLYLESFGNPRKFSRIARRVSRRKPIVAVKSGRTGSGLRATASHTGALVAASDATVDALFRQAGVIRTDSLEEMFDVAVLLANQPVPAGPRVAIVTNAGGPGILCADACEAEGLVVPVLSPATQEKLRTFLPAHAAVSNPVDLVASAPAEHYREAVAAVGADPNVDAVVVIFVPPLVTQAEDVAQAIVEGVARWTDHKPVLTVFMSARGVPELLRRSHLRIPSYAFPESAARALAHAVRYGQWRRRPAEPAARPVDARRDEALALVATAVERGAGWLAPAEVEALLRCYGVLLVAQRFALTPEEAGELAERFGGPVALKVVAPGVVHKTEVGGVLLDLRGRQEVERAAREMLARVSSAGYRVEGFVVQEMAPPGLEMIVGVASDRHFGPVVACGAGGVLVELLRDVSLRLAPLTRTDASEMVRELRTFPLLQGYRGSPPCDVEALEDLLVRVGALADDIPQVVELDLNPVRVYRQGLRVLDARVRVEPVRPPTWIARR
ncbi:MAG: GNAT family N-acetyltransferase [Armatimonadota bacterium]|nr:GNAT family N-acetyltransferase [Armatimonadota bacterium]MDR7387202.1 GNAT family N-acetyltransferase [Armatimonadota bacterium]MDR7388127.1 GNAT family N-acetyltransferase [Armatimonadota bacterium]MDR7395316.1 GNAT family N-acetyltransferase [Armatimonadota bacterium]MDR7398041.1 GNAT family N-acetyltransferase [Armatimonadota bacterium]